MSDFDVTRISEKKFYTIPDTALTANATANGLVTIPSTFQYKVGMIVSLYSNTQTHRRLKIKRVISETQMYLGEKETKIDVYSDLSAFLVADTAMISLTEQQRPVIDILEIQRQTYEEEPTVAIRNHLVDWLGRSYDSTNPIPVSLSPGSVELAVKLTHKDNFPNPGDVADSVQIGDGFTVAKIDPKNRSFSTNRYEKLLGLMANANWMKLGDFNQIVPTFTEDNAQLDYIQDGAIIGRAFFRFVDDMDWDISFERYINNTNGDLLLDDDGEELSLD